MSEEILSAIKIDEKARKQVEEALKKKSEVKMLVESKKQELTSNMNEEVNKTCEEYQNELSKEIDQHRAASQKRIEDVDAKLNSVVNDKKSTWINHIVEEVIGK